MKIKSNRMNRITNRGIMSLLKKSMSKELNKDMTNQMKLNKKRDNLKRRKMLY